MESSADYSPCASQPCRLVIWHTEGTAISGLLSWMWRLKKSLPGANIDLTIVSLEIQPFRFAQICEPEKIYDVRIRTPQEFIAFLKKNQSSVHIINHAYEYVDLLKKMAPGLLKRLRLAGICHTDQDYYYHHLERLDSHLAGIIAVSPRCVEKLEEILPHRAGTIPILPDWDMPIETAPILRPVDESLPLRIVFNGRMLDVQKRVLDLPEISRFLARSTSRIELTMVGDGPDLPLLREEFAREGHIPHRFLAPRAPWEMTELLEQHDAFLQVSEFEGASVSLMEAMTAGLIPVVTRTESGVDLLEDGRNSLLCPVGDPRSIAASLAGLARNRVQVPLLGLSAFQTARVYLQELAYVDRLREYLHDLSSSTQESFAEPAELLT